MENREDPYIQEALRRLSLYEGIKTSHNIVTWTVENFLDSPNPNTCYGTAAFTIGKHFGNFYLQMSPKFAEDSFHIQLGVKFEAAGEGNVCFRFGYKTANEIVWEAEQSSQFKGSFTVNKFSQNIMSYFNCNTKTFVIMCEFILTLHAGEYDKNVISSPESLKYNFPLDFFNLYNSGYLSDVTLLIGELKYEFHAHKAILYAKSRAFRKILSEMPENVDTIELLELNKENMLSLLLYIYTGSVDFWLSFYSPTALVYEYADKFEIEDIKKLLQPAEIALTQTTLVVPIDINFEIVNFNKLEENDVPVKTSPLYRSPYGLFFLSFPLDSSNMYHILLEPSDIWDCFTLHVNITVSYTETNDSKNYELKYFFDPNDLKIFEMGTFSKDSFNHSSEGTLSISGECLVSRHLPKCEFFFRRTNDSFRPQFGTFDSLLDSNPYSDLKFIVKDKEYLVHKFLLGTRLKCFKELFAMREDAKEISMDDVTPSTMELFLSYLYAGDIKIDTDIDHLLSLISVWKTYGNSAFGGTLFRLLNAKMDVTNVCKILWKLHALEEANFFDALKNAAMTYLCRNFAEIESSEFWCNAVTENEEIAKLTLQHMAEKYKLNNNYFFENIFTEIFEF